MKPVAFDYATAGERARGLRAARGRRHARVLAGGQTLIPMLAMRLARPYPPHRYRPHSRALRHWRWRDPPCDRRRNPAGGGRARSRSSHSKAPLLAKALPWVGHAPTRNRGTIGGSIANGDPAAEIPAGGRDARCNAGRRDRRGDERAGRRGLLSRADDHGAARGRNPRLPCASRSGPRAASARASTRCRRARATSPLLRPPRRSRSMPTAAALALGRRRRRGRRHARCVWTPSPKR